MRNDQMFHKRKHFKRLCVVVLIFLAFLYVVKFICSQKYNGKLRLQEALNELTSTATGVKLPLFVIDENILQLIHEYQKSGIYSVFQNNDANLLSFATTAYFVHSKDVIFEAFKSNFKVSLLPSSLIKSKGGHGVFKSNNFHFLLVHQRTKVSFHVVVFHEFMERYYYHSQIDFSSMDVPSVDNISYGVYPGIYDRKSLRTKVMVLGSVVLNIPFDIPRFFRAKNESLFLLCNETRAKQFKEKFTLETKGNEDDFMFFKGQAKSVLTLMSGILHQLGISFWISSGTCLGWFRQCDLIPYSKDVDIGIWAKDYVPGMISSIEEKGLHLIQSFGKLNDSYELSFTNGHIKLDIFFFYDTPHFAWNGGTQAKTGKKFKYIFKRFTHCWTIFLDILVKVPCNTEQYVRDNYGDDWFLPVKHWDWKKSPSNVYENGIWPEEEWKDVIQLF